MKNVQQTKTPTGLTPSPDSPAEKRKKVTAGRVGVTVLAGIAILAFVIYLIIILYGTMNAS